MRLRALLAQQPADPLPVFDIADGFAITLIAMLFAVLAGVAVVAYRFRCRDKRRTEGDRALDELMGRGPLEKPVPSKSPGAISGGGRKPGVPWERDGDWWRTRPDAED